MSWRYNWPHFIYTYALVFSHLVVSDSSQPRGPQHARPPSPSPTPGVYSNPCPLSRWCHPTITSSVVPFSSCPQSFSESGSFPVSKLFAWGGQSIGASASASVPPMNTQDWSLLGFKIVQFSVHEYSFLIFCLLILYWLSWDYIYIQLTRLLVSKLW